MYVSLEHLLMALNFARPMIACCGLLFSAASDYDNTYTPSVGDLVSFKGSLHVLAP
jgi:hypothetical protein